MHSLPPLPLTSASNTPRGGQRLPLIPLGVRGFAPQSLPSSLCEDKAGRYTRAHTHTCAHPHACTRPGTARTVPPPPQPMPRPSRRPHLPTSPQSRCPLTRLPLREELLLQTHPEGPGAGEAPPTGGPGVLGDPGQLLGLGVFGQEVNCTVTPRLSRFSPGREGRGEGGRQGKVPSLLPASLQRLRAAASKACPPRGATARPEASAQITSLFLHRKQKCKTADFPLDSGSAARGQNTAEA